MLSHLGIQYTDSVAVRAVQALASGGIHALPVTISVVTYPKKKTDVKIGNMSRNPQLLQVFSLKRSVRFRFTFYSVNQVVVDCAILQYY